MSDRPNPHLAAADDGLGPIAKALLAASDGRPYSDSAVGEMVRGWSPMEILDTYGITHDEILMARAAGWFRFIDPYELTEEYLGVELFVWIRAGCPATPKAAGR